MRHCDSESFSHLNEVTQLVSAGAGIVFTWLRSEAVDSHCLPHAPQRPVFKSELCPWLALDVSNDLNSKSSDNPESADSGLGC